MILSQGLSWRTASRVVAPVIAMAAFATNSAAAVLRVDLPSGQPVGTTITVSVDGESSADARYRFSVARAGGPARVVYDYRRANVFEWTPIDEGTYVVRVDIAVNGSTTVLTLPYVITASSPLAWIMPLVTATKHPLVALYSAPPCAPAAAMRVIYASSDSPITLHITHAKPCTADRTMNFYIGGMRVNHSYVLRHELLDALGRPLAYGDPRWFQTGIPPVLLPATIVAGVPGIESSAESIILQSPVGGNPSRSIEPFAHAVDVEGHVVWYTDRIDTVPRPVGNGLFTMLTAEAGIRTGLRMFDLVGNTVRETNVERINDQLRAMGADPINDVHHEARLLPNGHMAVLGSVERIVTDVQGPGEVDVLGDAVLVLDENFQVVWVWNAFDHLPVGRKATTGETCWTLRAGCSPVYLRETANDWTHANAITYDPADGNLLVSIRSQDWVVKIDYRNGAGAGAVLWRLGADGDIALDGVIDPFPWFSHQHDPNLSPDHHLVVYDNGNLRCKPNPSSCHSRGQVYEIDELNRRARLVVNADLGRYAFALGSAQALSNGNYYFDSGSLTGPDGNLSVMTEVRPDGTSIYSVASDTFTYRSHRLFNLYVTPPEWGTTHTLTLLELLNGVP